MREKPDKTKTTIDMASIFYFAVSDTTDDKNIYLEQKGNVPQQYIWLMATEALSKNVVHLINLGGGQ